MDFSQSLKPSALEFVVVAAIGVLGAAGLLLAQLPTTLSLAGCVFISLVISTWLIRRPIYALKVSCERVELGLNSRFDRVDIRSSKNRILPFALALRLQDGSAVTLWVDQLSSTQWHILRYRLTCLRGEPFVKS